MGSFLEHTGEAKEFAVAWFIDDHFLVVFIDGSHAHFAGEHYVGAAIGVADFVDALVRREFFDFDLRSQHRGFLVIKKRKQRYMFQFLSIASHGPPLRNKLLAKVVRGFHTLPRLTS